MFYLVTILILIFNVSCASEQTVHKGSGFCVVIWKERKASYEPYSYTKREYRYERCGWRDCRKEVIVTKSDKRLVYKDVPQQRVECCPGYSKKMIHDTVYDCEPICSPSCLNGVCSAPGNCTCQNGFKHVSSHQCGPLCEPACVNSLCTMPNECTCIEGYRQVNSSYCTPYCSETCVNGYCIAPDTCSCNPGFRMNQENNWCEPYCENACVNSECVSFNECKCHDGYIKNSSQINICEPYCSLECIHGRCSAPENCTCEDGYHLGNTTWNICQPDCNCTNGYCDEPHKCICFDNYTLNEEGECVPYCNECENGTCTAPNVCECFDGFKMGNNSKCIPDCTDCTHGVCSAPEVCECFYGYRSEDGTCVPDCEPSCVNGLCTSPNQCSCNDNYDEILPNICFPTCVSNCSSCNYSDTDCLIAENIVIKEFKELTTDLRFYYAALYNMQLHTTVDCSFFQRYNSNNSSTHDANNRLYQIIDCSKIGSIGKTFHFLCLWKNSTDLVDIFVDSPYPSNITANSVQATVLLPKLLKFSNGSCDLCPLSANSSFEEKSTVTLEMYPCPAAKFKNEQLSSDYTLKYVIIGLMMITMIVLTSFTLHVLYKRRLTTYILVRKSDSSGGNDLADEMEILQETEH